MNFISTFGAVVGAFLSARSLQALLLGWWRRGLGQRRAWAKNFGHLAPGVRLAYVESLFGQPAFESSVPAKETTFPSGDHTSPTVENRSVVEHVWALGADGYLTVWSEEGRVHSFSLTTAVRRFHPKIRIGSAPDSNGAFVVVHLGRTTFSEIDSVLQPNHLREVASWMGARRHEYVESYTFGNLGYYQTWACGASNAGYQPARRMALPSMGVNGEAVVPASGLVDLSQDQLQRLYEFRAGMSVNSIRISPTGTLEIIPGAPRTGPDEDQVRMLEPQLGWWNGLVRRRAIRSRRREIERQIRALPGG